ncbi:lysozyme inhibitor LprI family protein [Pseudescherichia sp.]|uniref:lysozyme inhibitor LprI family protein n=1 Tax=Pseudescherichia sp. TaxID=2055881 RepID=UPI0028998ACD|nr:lysozyme inhibitor LprI family protein [Pseudescherichia sp.]
MRKHKIIILSMLVVAISSARWEALAKDIPHDDLLSNQDVEKCAAKPDEESYDCSDKLIQNSDNTLQDSFRNKLKEIESANYSQWWMGSEEQRKTMSVNFANSQKAWEQYKLTYCKSAAAPYENTHGYGDTLSSCFINMNRKRVAEINMISVDSAR